MKSFFQRPVPVVLGSLLLLCSAASGSQLLVNGGFEAGDLSGWTETDQAGGTGTWLARNAPSGSISGLPTVGASSGAWYALSDQGGPGAHSLTQSFTVGAGSSVTFSFDMFVNAAAPVAKPASLDYTVIPSEHGRVDLLTGGAAPFDVGAGVLFNFYDGADPGTNPHPYTHYSFDISPLVAAGGTFKIRFAEADNQSFFNMGVDNVSVDATAAGAVPEPGTIGFMAIGMAAVLAGIRRRTS